MVRSVLLLLLVNVLIAQASEADGHQESRKGSFLGTRSQAGAGVSLVLQKRRIREKAKSGDSRVQHKMAYFGPLTVGSPAQQFSVVYDTGSGNLIVPGSTCNSDACIKHHRFDSNKSSTSKAVNCDGSDPGSGGTDEITISFGTGTITGACYNDKICIGNACSVGDFIVSTDESEQPFASFNFDGVLGLALLSMAQSDAFHMMERMTKQKELKRPIFSVFLSDSDQEASEITFGAIKPEHMASELFWVPVNGNAGYWEVGIDDITFGDVPQSLCKDCRVAVDTGTSQLAGPSDVIGKLSSSLNVKDDCTNYATLPRLGFIVGGRILHLEPRDYVDKRDLESGASCSVSLMDLDVPPPKGPLFVFGIPFLQKYYSVYDHENSKVGFAVAKHVGETPESLVQIDLRKLRH